eukprot:gene22645-biopygen13297
MAGWAIGVRSFQRGRCWSMPGHGHHRRNRPPGDCGDSRRSRAAAQGNGKCPRDARATPAPPQAKQILKPAPRPRHLPVPPGLKAPAPRPSRAARRGVRAVAAMERVADQGAARGEVGWDKWTGENGVGEELDGAGCLEKDFPVHCHIPAGEMDLFGNQYICKVPFPRSLLKAVF